MLGTVKKSMETSTSDGFQGMFAMSARADSEGGPCTCSRWSRRCRCRVSAVRRECEGRPKSGCRGSFSESVSGFPGRQVGVRVARAGPCLSTTGGIPCGARQSPYPVLRCRVPSATRPMFHKTKTTASGQTGSVSASSRSAAARQADGEARLSQGAMPPEFGKPTAPSQGMPITRG